MMAPPTNLYDLVHLLMIFLGVSVGFCSRTGFVTFFYSFYLSTRRCTYCKLVFDTILCIDTFDIFRMLTIQFDVSGFNETSLIGCPMMPVLLCLVQLTFNISHHQLSLSLNR